MARRGDDLRNNEQDATMRRRYQRPQMPSRQRQTQPDDQGQEWQKDIRQEDESSQPSLASFGETSTDTEESEIDLQTASREELEAMAFELDIDEFESMDREELVSEIEERN